jgi:hypothetical protein
MLAVQSVLWLPSESFSENLSSKAKDSARKLELWALAPQPSRSERLVGEFEPLRSSAAAKDCCQQVLITVASTNLSFASKVQTERIFHCVRVRTVQNSWRPFASWELTGKSRSCWRLFANWESSSTKSSSPGHRLCVDCRQSRNPHSQRGSEQPPQL